MHGIHLIAMLFSPKNSSAKFNSFVFLRMSLRNFLQERQINRSSLHTTLQKHYVSRKQENGLVSLLFFTPWLILSQFIFAGKLDTVASVVFGKWKKLAPVSIIFLHHSTTLTSYFIMFEGNYMYMLMYEGHLKSNVHVYRSTNRKAIDQ